MNHRQKSSLESSIKRKEEQLWEQARGRRPPLSPSLLEFDFSLYVGGVDRTSVGHSSWEIWNVLVTDENLSEQNRSLIHPDSSSTLGDRSTEKTHFCRWYRLT